MTNIKTFKIYKISFPNGKFYIGFTSMKLSERMQKHYYKMRKGLNYPLYNALRKYSNQESVDVLDTCYSLEDAVNKEIFFIKKFDSYNNGYNQTIGGEGTLGFSPSLETRKKIAKANTGKVKSLEDRLNISKRFKGIGKTEEHCKKISLANKGRLSKLKGTEKPRLEKLKLAESRNSKPFLVYEEKTGKFIGKWELRSECAKSLNLRKEYIRDCLNKPSKHKSACGFIFKYVG